MVQDVRLNLQAIVAADRLAVGDRISASLALPESLALAYERAAEAVDIQDLHRWAHHNDLPGGGAFPPGTGVHVLKTGPWGGRYLVAAIPDVEWPGHLAAAATYFRPLPFIVMPEYLLAEPGHPTIIHELVHVHQILLSQYRINFVAGGWSVDFCRNLALMEAEADLVQFLFQPEGETVDKDMHGWVRITGSARSAALAMGWENVLTVAAYGEYPLRMGEKPSEVFRRAYSSMICSLGDMAEAWGVRVDRGWFLRIGRRAAKRAGLMVDWDQIDRAQDLEAS